MLSLLLTKVLLPSIKQWFLVNLTHSTGKDLKYWVLESKLVSAVLPVLFLNHSEGPRSVYKCWLILKTRFFSIVLVHKKE